MMSIVFYVGCSYSFDIITLTSWVVNLPELYIDQNYDEIDNSSTSVTSYKRHGIANTSDSTFVQPWFQAYK